MGFFSRTRFVVSPLIDIPRWIDAERLIGWARFIWELILSFFVVKQAQGQETFEEASQRLNLTEEVLAQRSKEFRRLFFIFFFLTLVVLGWSIYLAIYLTWWSALMGFVIAGYAAAQTFRFHFWLFQIKERRLGCSFRDWLSIGVFGKRP